MSEPEAAETRRPDYDAFYREVEPRIRRALVAAGGAPVDSRRRRAPTSSATSSLPPTTRSSPSPTSTRQTAS